MWDSHLPGVSRNVGFVPVRRDGRCAWTGLDGVGGATVTERRRLSCRYCAVLVGPI